MSLLELITLAIAVIGIMAGIMLLPDTEPSQRSMSFGSGTLTQSEQEACKLHVWKSVQQGMKCQNCDSTPGRSS